MLIELQSQNTSVAANATSERNGWRICRNWVTMSFEGVVKGTFLEAIPEPSLPDRMAQRCPIRYFKMGPEIFLLSDMLYVWSS